MAKETIIRKKRLGRILTDNALTRYITFSALYIAQGIPEGITFFAIPAWLAMNGKSAMEIGAYVGVVGIPLCIGLIPDPLNNLSALMVAGFFISFFGAFQDVATDGMAVDVIPENEQARANGLMWGAKTIGISASLLIGTWLINTFGFPTAISSLSIAVATIMLFPIYFKERPGEKTMPWTAGAVSPDSKQTQLRSWKHIFKCLYKVLRLKSSLVFGLGVFAVGLMFGLIDTLLPIFSIQELGWTNSYFSNVFSITTVIGGFLGMFIGGYLVDYFGKIKMLSLYLFFLTLLIAVFASLSNLWGNNLIVYAFILSYYTLYTFLCIAVFASAMHLCWKTVAATQFTLYMALSNMGRAAGAAMLGVLKTNFTWEIVFLIIAAMPVIMIILIQLINFKKHRVTVDSFVILKQTVVAPPALKD